MNCPNCNRDLTENICEYCGIDAALYHKALRMSALHYNKGLEAAKSNDLRSAISFLRSAVEINKRNINARNLLGLCFYATGRMGEALQQWAISCNINMESNVAGRYLSKCKQDAAVFDGNTKAVSLYNEALRYMRQGSDDLAVIRLRRAIELSPDSVDALNLLTLAYLKQNDKTKAAATVERVLAIDTGNVIAKRYYQQIFRRKPSARQSQPQARQAITVRQPKTEQHPVKNYHPFGDKSRKSPMTSFAMPGVATFLIGVLCMFLFMHFLIVPDIRGMYEREVAELSRQLADLQEYHDLQTQERDEYIAERRADIESLRGRLDETSSYNAYLRNNQQVMMAHVHMQWQRHDMALETLNEAFYAMLGPDLAEVYHHVRAVSTPIVEQNYFAEGQRLFNGQNFLEAQFALEQAAALTHLASPIAGNIYYLLGRIAEHNGDTEQAREFYVLIVENQLRGTGANRVTAANNRLRGLPAS